MSLRDNLGIADLEVYFQTLVRTGQGKRATVLAPYDASTKVVLKVHSAAWIVHARNPTFILALGHGPARPIVVELLSVQMGRKDLSRLVHCRPSPLHLTHQGQQAPDGYRTLLLGPVPGQNWVRTHFGPTDARVLAALHSLAASEAAAGLESVAPMIKQIGGGDKKFLALRFREGCLNPFLAQCATRASPICNLLSSLFAGKPCLYITTTLPEEALAAIGEEDLKLALEAIAPGAWANILARQAPPHDD
jgi:hypothetical protein